MADQGKVSLITFIYFKKGISQEIVKQSVNTELKVMFRLVESSKKALVSDSTSMDEQDTKQLG